MRQPGDLRVTQIIFTGSLLCSIMLCVVLISRQSPLWAALLSGLIVVAFASWFLIGYLFRAKRSIGWFLSLAVLNFFVVAPELALRVADFHYESGIQFGYPRPEQFVRFVPDKNLFWKLPSSNPNVSSLGFPGREIAVPKSKNVYRVLFLGDSCTQWGYPDIVELFLNSTYAKDAKRFESVTLAISGYTSHQGRVIADLYGLKLDPDLVAVYFGWNDHWLAYGAIDSEKVMRESKAFFSEIIDVVYHKSRLLQRIKKLSHSVVGFNPDTPLHQVRVPPDQYRENLAHISKVFGKAHIPVIFITAPTSHYRFGVPDYLIDMKFARDKASAVMMHRKYNQIVREIAKEPGAFLLDLEPDFNEIEDLGKIFDKDGIHFTPAGLALVAKRISDFMERTVLSSEPDPVNKKRLFHNPAPPHKAFE